jgi:midasin (ATPase involved in ribosome maturation)
LKRIGGGKASLADKINHLKQEREKKRREFSMKPEIKLYDTIVSNKMINTSENTELTIEERRADSSLAMKRIVDFKNQIIKSKKFSNKRTEEYNRLLKLPLNLKTTLRIKMPCNKTLDIVLGRFKKSFNL